MQIYKITQMKNGGGDTDIGCNYINVGGDNNWSNTSTDNDDIYNNGADNDHRDYCDNNTDYTTITLLIT